MRELLSSLDYTLQPLRSYPPGLVLFCAFVLGSVLLVLLAKPLKWVLYITLVVLFVGALVVFATWLFGAIPVASMARFGMS